MLASAPEAPGAPGPSAGGWTLSRWEYVVTQLRVVATYLRLWIAPAGQNVDPDVVPSRSLLEPAVVLSAALLVALLAAAVVLYRRAARPDFAPELRLAGVGILWFFGTLTVESAFPLADALVEHRVYLPSAGLSIAVAALAVTLRDRLRATRPAWGDAVLPVLAAAIGLLGVATFARNAVWRDELVLWEDAARKSPAKLRPRLQLAALYLQRGRAEDALREARNAVTLEPASAEAWNSLGVVLRRQGRIDEAMASYAAAVRLKPTFAEARYNAALVLVAQGRTDDGVRELEEAVRARPDYAEAHNALGALYAQQGRMPEAIREWETTLRLNPANAKARANLQRALGGM
jgi:Flp pilus assembly protein TadD